MYVVVFQSSCVHCSVPVFWRMLLFCPTPLCYICHSCSTAFLITVTVSQNPTNVEGTQMHVFCTQLYNTSLTSLVQIEHFTGPLSALPVVSLAMADHTSAGNEWMKITTSSVMCLLCHVAWKYQDIFRFLKALLT